jgi:D-alanyl-D-alanine carboxypeptidase
MRERETTFNEAAFEAEQKPFPKAVVSEGVSLGAHAVFSTFIDREGKGHVLLEKNKDVRLPIASVTKLMVALIASETLRQETVVVSKSALQSKGISGSYRVGDTFLVDEALHGLLIGSHNEIAISMAEQVGMEQFIEQMNEKARVLGLKNTHFVNVTGLDPEPGKEEMNYSSAADIATLLAYIFEHKTHLASILGKSEYTLTMAQGARKIAVRTTNDLLATHNTALRVLGGKTGETPKAKMNLAIVSEAPASGRIVSVVLSSDDSFYDMRKVLQYLQDSFVW